MPEPESNQNSRLLVDPPGWMRRLIALSFSSVTDTTKIEQARKKAEKQRRASGQPHRVAYFHQLDDPYSHLTAQILLQFAQKYDIELVAHLIPPSGGKNQPKSEQLAALARRDAALIAPHFGLEFPTSAGRYPDPSLLKRAGTILAGCDNKQFVERISEVSTALWTSEEASIEQIKTCIRSSGDYDSALQAGKSQIQALGHYSGATFFYGGEWYWGVDRLFHLEARLQTLGATHEDTKGFIAPRPEIDVSGIDASRLTLDFYPSLNSPYTSIIYDRVLDLKSECGVNFRHKPVLPMIMRGVPITRAKGRYIMFDTKREADWAGVPFGKMITPIGEPTRMAYALMPWAMSIGQDEALMSSLLHHAFALGTGLHTTKGLRRAIEAAGLSWSEAERHFSDVSWKQMVERFQNEMNEDLGLWGVPSFRLSGPVDEEDLIVWGQDRLWLVAREIKRRGRKI